MKTNKPNLVFFQVILSAFALASAGLILFGFYTASWFAGFGVVLLMTTLIGVTAFRYAPDESPDKSVSMDPPLGQPGLSRRIPFGSAALLRKQA